MGGNAKHMPHIWEHLDCTFADVFSLLEGLTAGTITAVEKFDGINIHFRVDSLGVVHFSRNDSERKMGGITFLEMLTKYQTHPARKTIIEGSRAIDEHFSSVWWPFGFSGQNWLNSEIIYMHRPQLLKYDKNAVVLHEVVTYLPDGKKLTNIDLQEGMEKVTSGVPLVTSTGFPWHTLAPQPVILTPQQGDGFLTAAITRLRQCLESCHLTDQSTLREFLRESLLRGMISELAIGSARQKQLANRIAGFEAPTLVSIKKGLSPGLAKKVSEMGQAKNRDKIQRKAMKPIVNTISAFGVQRLSTACSTLVEEPQREIQRLVDEIIDCRTRIDEASDHDALPRRQLFEELISEYESLGGCPTAIEGIAFKWNDKVTKLTGLFATLNQALGVDRYGRGQIGPTPQNVENFSLVEWFGLV